MGVIRNFINVIGITSEEELPDRIKGQMIHYSDLETIFIPNDKPEIKNIYEIMVEVEIKSSRTIDGPLGKTIILDGIKKYKIIYVEKGHEERANIIHLNTPYNTFFEIPTEKTTMYDCKVYILDAYFDLLSERQIYSHTVYMVEVQYDLEDYHNKGLKYTEKERMREEVLLGELSIAKEILGKENSSFGKNNSFDMDEEYL